MKILKHWKKGLLAVLMVLCFSLTAFAYTFDGEIDPAIFPSWEVISSVQLSPSEVTVIAKNPDTEGRVIIKLEHHYGWGIMGYGYTIDGHTVDSKTHVYLFNSETVNYDETVE